jgi:PhnB protein
MSSVVIADLYSYVGPVGADSTRGSRLFCLRFFGGACRESHGGSDYRMKAQTETKIRLADAELRRKQGGDAMTALTPYLLFDGNCKQAMEFYKTCIGGELTQMLVKDSPVKDSMPAFQHEKILNARLASENVDLSASDWLRPDRTPVPGNTVCLYLRAGTFEELSALFARLSEGGNVTDPLKEMFFGTYGALNDKFGVRWMFQCNAGS